MEIFRLGIKFNSWGEIYAGLRKDIISWEQAFKLIRSDNVLFRRDKKRITELELLFNKSAEYAYERIRDFLIEDGGLQIKDKAYEQLDAVRYIPDVYYKIWMLEIALRIDRTQVKVRNKLHMVHSDLYFRFGYHRDLKTYMPRNENELDRMGDDEIKSIYDCLKKYFDQRIKYYLELNKRIEKINVNEK